MFYNQKIQIDSWTIQNKISQGFDDMMFTDMGATTLGLNFSFLMTDFGNKIDQNFCNVLSAFSDSDSRIRQLENRVIQLENDLRMLRADMQSKADIETLQLTKQLDPLN